MQAFLLERDEDQHRVQCKECLRRRVLIPWTDRRRFLVRLPAQVHAATSLRGVWYCHRRAFHTYGMNALRFSARGMRCAELKRAGVRCAVLTWAIVSFEDIATLADNSRVCTASQAQNCSVSLPPTLSLSCCSLALPLSHTLPLPPLSVLPWPSLSITLSSLSPRLRSHTHTRSLLLALSPALSRCTTDVFLPRLSQEFAYCERVDGVPTCTCRPGQSTMVLRLSS